MNTALQDFLIYMSLVKKASANTIASYRNDLTKLIRHLDQQNIVEVSKISETSINSYILSMEREGMSPATVSRNIAAIKAFIFFLIRKGILHEDPTERIRSPKVEKKPPHTLSLEQINGLLEQPNNNSKKGIRDKAMLELLYATGIRVTELISINMEDVNLKNKYIRCNSTNKERIIPFGNKAKQALEIYFQKVRSEILGKMESNVCFTNLSGEPMSRQGFWKIIKSYGKSAGIEDEITPQILRHSFAVHMMENGADIKSVQELLGYSDVTSTQVYMQARKGKIRDVYESTHPRA
jgi:integrase/recombinase XerD